MTIVSDLRLLNTVGLLYNVHFYSNESFKIISFSLNPQEDKELHLLVVLTIKYPANTWSERVYLFQQ